MSKPIILKLYCLSQCQQVIHAHALHRQDMMGHVQIFIFALRSFLIRPPSELLHLYTPSWQLCSSANTQVFRIPSFQTKSYSQHSFYYQAPVIWNQLPVCPSFCHCQFFQSFLKTFPFENIFVSLIALIYDSVHACVCVCVHACLHAWVHACMWCVGVLHALNLKNV